MIMPPSTAIYRQPVYHPPFPREALSSLFRRTASRRVNSLHASFEDQDRDRCGATRKIGKYNPRTVVVSSQSVLSAQAHVHAQSMDGPGGRKKHPVTHLDALTTEQPFGRWQSKATVAGALFLALLLLLSKHNRIDVGSDARRCRVDADLARVAGVLRSTRRP